METTIINFNGVDLWVEYEYTAEEKGTYDYPGYPEDVEIKEICIAYTDWNITDKTSVKEDEQIKQIILSKVAA